MRTTVTLDPDTAALIHSAMEERGVSFRKALNDAVRRGLGSGAKRVTTPTHSMGHASADLDKALALADELEDGEIVHELERGR